ncbi:MAG: ParB N-terminal domain-containing protein [Rhodoferax sp.]|nr:ParB N-terminal domain-containing protein [Rhodoferax sp.]
MTSPPESQTSNTPDVHEQDVGGYVGAKQIDLHRLELRFEATRISDPAAVQRLSESIQASGQLVACIAAGDQDNAALVLIDGYRRVNALKRLGADTALVQCWHCPVGPALAQMLAHSFSRAFDPMEEALMLRELIDSLGLSQREAARQCARDVSWVQRRLVLLAALPGDLVQAVRNAQVSSWAAARILAPLARANSAHASQLLAGMGTNRLSTRELQAWFVHYQSSQHMQRQRMVEHPRLFIDSLNERQSQSIAKDLRGGPEREVASELGYLQALLQRACRRLEPLNAPLEPALKGACVRLHATLPEVSNELKRLMP